MKNKGRFFLLGSVSLCLTLPVMAFADNLSPESYTAEIDVGESITINQTVTVDTAATTSKVDVFFLTDTTGSMGGLINSVQSSATEILSSTSAFGDVAFGVGEYKDWADSYAYRLNTAITTDTAAVTNGISMLSASGGGDYYEANLYALEQVATSTETGWRDDSAKVLVWFGDAPGHDPSGTTTEASAIDALNSKNIVVEAMDTGRLNETGQAQRIADATGGDYHNSINTDAIVTTIGDAITTVLDKYNEISLDLSGVPTGIDASVDLTSITGDFDRSIQRTFDFEVTLKGITEGTYNFEIGALVDGGLVATASDKITVLAGGPPSTVPEPSSVLLLGIGITGLAGLLRRRKV